MKTLLLVDDEPLLRETLVAALSGELPGTGYEVLTAENGLRAIELLARRRVDLVITDVSMPHVDGFSLLKYLDAHHPRLPAIVLTGYGFPGAELFVQNLGARGLIEKPFALETLARRIEELLAETGEESSLQGFGLYSFLQMMELEKKTGLVRVQAGGERSGQICFARGALVHANASVGADARQGEAAVTEMLAWREPRLRIAHGFETPARNVHATLSRLLMESARHFDERTAAATAPEGADRGSAARG